MKIAVLTLSCVLSLLFKLFDTDSLRLMNTYKTERPVNSASLSPIREHVSIINC